MKGLFNKFLVLLSVVLFCSMTDFSLDKSTKVDVDAQMQNIETFSDKSEQKFDIPDDIFVAVPHTNAVIISSFIREITSKMHTKTVSFKHLTLEGHQNQTIYQSSSTTGFNIAVGYFIYTLRRIII